MTETFKVPAPNLPAMGEALAKLSRRATKLGVTPPTFTVGERFEVVERHPVTGLKTGRVNVYFAVTLDAEVVKLAGWTFLGTLDHTSEAGVVLRAVPGESLTAYRDSKPTCDHCGWDRRRNETFIVRHDDGTEKKVGRNCLADFLGADPMTVARKAEYLALFRGLMEDSESEGFGGGGGRASYDMEIFLNYVAWAVRNIGWVSRKTERENPSRHATAGTAASMMFLKDKKSDEHPTDEDKAEAALALEWARSLRNNGTELSDYEHNVAVVAASDTLDPKNTGIAASFLPAAGRVRARARVRVRDEASVHFGTVGKRAVFTLTHAMSRSFDGDYGVRWMHKFHDGNGNVAIWWTGKELERPYADKAGNWNVPEGATVTLKATVKSHTVYHGVKNTNLSRAVLESVEEAETMDAVGARFL